ncbi:unnamed protein product [Closterium sp. NIES-54]
MQSGFRHPDSVPPGLLARLACLCFLPASSLATACGMQVRVGVGLCGWGCGWGCSGGWGCVHPPPGLRAPGARGAPGLPLLPARLLPRHRLWHAGGVGGGTVGGTVGGAVCFRHPHSVPLGLVAHVACLCFLPASSLATACGMQVRVGVVVAVRQCPGAGACKQEQLCWTMTLRRSIALTLRSVALTLRRVALTLRRVALTLRSVALTLRRVALTLRSVALTLRSVALNLRSIAKKISPARVQAGACSAEKNEFACRSFHRTSYLVALPAPGAAAMPPFHTHVVPPCPSQQVLIDLVGVVHVIVAVLFERSLPLSPHTPRMHAPPPPPLAPPDRF